MFIILFFLDCIVLNLSKIKVNNFKNIVFFWYIFFSQLFIFSSGTVGRKRNPAKIFHTTNMSRVRVFNPLSIAKVSQVVYFVRPISKQFSFNLFIFANQNFSQQSCLQKISNKLNRRYSEQSYGIFYAIIPKLTTHFISIKTNF